MGRKAGLTEVEMDALFALNPDDFSRKEWVALAYARDWALFRGDIQDKKLLQEFESLYSEQQRRDIQAVLVCMNLNNRSMNTLTGKALSGACEI